MQNWGGFMEHIWMRLIFVVIVVVVAIVTILNMNFKWMFENFEWCRYKAAARALFLQERMSGARPYNIINWDVNPPCRELPPWPDKPPTPPPPPPPDTRQPLNTSKGALSFGHVYGAFGTINVPWLVTSQISLSHFLLEMRVLPLYDRAILTCPLSPCFSSHHCPKCATPNLLAQTQYQLPSDVQELQDGD